MNEKEKINKKHQAWIKLGFLRGWKRLMPLLKKENRETKAHEDLRVTLMRIV